MMAVALGCMAMLWACGPKKAAETPEAEVYAEYVKAYTGGIISPDAVIRVELAQDAAQRPADVFSFKPAIEGATQWESESVVTFKPEALEPGQTYMASFALGKVSNGPKTFDFGFTVRKAAAQPVEEIDTRDGFRVRKATLEDSRIDIVLSEAPVNAAKKGMVELQGVARSYVQVEDSLVRVYFEGRKGDLVLTVDKNVKTRKETPWKRISRKCSRRTGKSLRLRFP